MATIRFKHNQEWRNLEIPLQVIVNESEGGSNLENVVITNSSVNAAAFPDLSPYISDMEQIQLMMWVEQSTITENKTKYNKALCYVYAPCAADKLLIFEIQNQANNGTTTPTLTTYVSDRTGTYTISGSINSLKRKHINSGAENDMSFNANLYLYYKGE